ncbi:MAG: hypothetical protein M0018_05420 [Nitrospiraceae bacterium]|nr:hypothetical protein [Nitrospiraceae bacterium]
MSNQISGMKSKNIYKPVCLLLICFSLFSCISKHGPKQVKGQLRFGEYSVLPPKGYWYFPREYPAKFNTSKDYFVITFWKDKDTIFKAAKAASSKKPLPAGYSIGPFFNFFITKNTYKNFEEYYNSALRGFKFNPLPKEADILNSEANWSCKQSDFGSYGINCTSLGKRLVVIGVFGKDEAVVAPEIPTFKQMLDSIKYVSQ